MTRSHGFTETLNRHNIHMHSATVQCSALCAYVTVSESAASSHSWWNSK